jgi:LysR family glycine cleavage system transcriptional activator
MRRGLLPLTALRSFEAAGRHLSFTRAADELAVSQAAVSRQVRDLETLLGQPLFLRGHRKVTPTPAGADLLSRVTEAFDLISGALSIARAQRSQATLTLSVEPSFASGWLVPALEEFRRLRPDIDVLVRSETKVAELRGGDVDLAIRHGAGSWPRTESRLLRQGRESAIMSPELARGLEVPADVARLTLIHEWSREYWADWFQACGSDFAGARLGPLLPDGPLSIQAARMGQGAILMDPLFVGPDLRGGALVRPFNLSVPRGSCWLVAESFATLGEPAQAFTAWITARLAIDQLSAVPAPA